MRLRRAGLCVGTRAIPIAAPRRRGGTVRQDRPALDALLRVTTRSQAKIAARSGWLRSMIVQAVWQAFRRLRERCPGLTGLVVGLALAALLHLRPRRLVQQTINANEPESISGRDPDAGRNGATQETQTTRAGPSLGQDVWGRDARRLQTELLSDREV